eukprot:3343341-Prymnesium_polylepis.2
MGNGRYEGQRSDRMRAPGFSQPSGRVPPPATFAKKFAKHCLLLRLTKPSRRMHRLACCLGSSRAALHHTPRTALHISAACLHPPSSTHGAQDAHEHQHGRRPEVEHPNVKLFYCS